MTSGLFRRIALSVMPLVVAGGCAFAALAEEQEDKRRDVGIGVSNVKDAVDSVKDAKEAAKAEKAAKWKEAVEQHQQAQDAAGEKAIQDARAKMTSEEKAKEWKQTVENANRQADAAGEKAIRKVEQEKVLTQEKIEKWKQVKAADDAAQTAAGERAVRQQHMEQLSAQEKIAEWNKVKAADDAAQDAASEALMRGEKLPEKVPVKAPASATKTGSAPTTGVKKWAQGEVSTFKAGVKSGMQELKAGAKDAGTYLKVVEIGDNAYQIMNAETDEELATAVQGAATGVALDIAQAALGKSAPVLALGTAAVQAGTKASENIADYADYDREADGLNYNVGVRNREEQIFQDLARAQGGTGISKEEARRLAIGYVNGEAKSIEKVEEMYKGLGKAVPKQEQAERSVGEAAADIMADTAEAGWGLVKGVGEQAAHTAEAVYQGGKETIGLVTDGALGELYDQRKEALAGDNLDAGMEVIGNNVREGWNAGVKKVDESVEYVKDVVGLNHEKHIDEAAVEQIRETVKGWGASDVYADKIAEKFFSAATPKEGVQLLAAARNEILANKAAREEAQSLREAEGGELPPAGDVTSVADDPEGGSLGGFARDRETERAETTAGDNAFVGLTTTERAQEGWNEQIEFTSRMILDEGAAAAQEIERQSAAETAAAQDANSWSDAIADGIEQGISAGLTAAGMSFGGALGDEVGQRAADSLFGEPEPKHHFDDDWQPSGGGESVASGGDPEHEIAITQVADANGNPVGEDSPPAGEDEGSPPAGEETASAGEESGDGGDSGHTFTITQVADANGNPVGEDSPPATKTETKSQSSSKCEMCGRTDNYGYSGWQKWNGKNVCSTCYAEAYNQAVDRAIMEASGTSSGSSASVAANKGSTSSGSQAQEVEEIDRCSNCGLDDSWGHMMYGNYGGKRYCIDCLWSLENGRPLTPGVKPPGMLD